MQTYVVWYRSIALTILAASLSSQLVGRCAEPAIDLTPSSASEKHWSYIVPQRPALPAQAASTWCRDPVDAFVLARMHEHGLQPAAPAERAELLRRVHLDLTGLPPSPLEVQRFLADTRPDAYERLVDCLLASPQFGQQMTVGWLDLARYADTHGYHTDGHRDMWRWRDWVIEAWNRNLPFDQFTVEQLAGDLLPDATIAQRIATGFHRNHMINFEAGSIDEEYRVEYVADRVVTTSAVWLGQTIGCARCHDHHYDPFTQRDFYQLFAFFNQVPEKGLDGEKGNADPVLVAPTPTQSEKLAAFDHQLARLDTTMRRRATDVERHLAEWERQIAAGVDDVAQALDAVRPSIHLSFDESETSEEEAANSVREIGGLIRLPGRFGEAMLFDGDSFLETATRGDFERDAPFTVAIWVFPTTKDVMGLLAHREPTDRGRGWSLSLHDGSIEFRLVHDGPARAIRIRSRQTLKLRSWQHVCVTYNGNSTASGVRVLVGGQVQPCEVVSDELAGSIRTNQPLRIGWLHGHSGFRGMLDDVRIYDGVLPDTALRNLVDLAPVMEIINVPSSQRTPVQHARLKTYFLENHDPEYRRLRGERDALRLQRAEYLASLPTVMVMEDQDPPRETFVLERGDYRQPGDRVEASTPAALPGRKSAEPRNRLHLAQWLVDRNNPLTARVTVNRFWRQMFGVGLVDTPGDFGHRGNPPSHPQLLDWLAVEFMDSGWDTKRLLRRIAASAAYRQTSAVSPAAVAADPNNRWLSRGPRKRLTAEMLRDQALAAGGLLVERMGGPSVFPYQPPGLWEAVSYGRDELTAQRYRHGHGADLYRRSLYTFWKRTSPPPSMTVLDATDRETCTVQRTASTTPLQSLVLWNDPIFVEAARGLAKRARNLAEEDETLRLYFLYRAVVSRDPSSAELTALRELLTVQLAAFQGNEAAAQVLLAVGEMPIGVDEDSTELAAWTSVASVVLSTHEALTR